ncbi:hypothetical protein HMJ29_18630 [Hymenobacter taeanensis]|uniref:Uncharacterized protein n=1 Tax=Hymenobacter taeanensis TaxID=2735321 RepID=A0A6M6BLF5_9BACT|nr:hypothetical protein [Hymenobacter taeanensis]QJX48817.1 hypothetical protein HMJ29_18630 [Hymenobacter taeanensis]
MARIFLLLWLFLAALVDASPALADQGGPAARAKMRGKVYVHRPNYKYYARSKRTKNSQKRWYQFWKRRKAKKATPAPARPSRNQTLGGS